MHADADAVVARFILQQLSDRKARDAEERLQYRRELDQIVEDRLRDVMTGPGLGVVTRGEYFAHPQIVELVEKARDRPETPG